MAANDKDKGLYGKYIIEKTDGTPLDPRGRYFVLHYNKCPHARKALKVYAESVKDEFPLLSRDLLTEIAYIESQLPPTE